ncbi:MAG: YjgN family protein [Cellvibrionaceae bacterium]
MELASNKTQQYPFEFTGKTGEYFKIWIVNILLTIVTLGIYAAWAKVRNHKYFYGNTYVDGSSFNYTANPVKILKGRLIAVLLVIIYQASLYFFPSNSGFVIIALGFVIPAIIVMSMAFRMRYSSWRGINFSFERDYKSAYLLFLPVIIYFIVFGLFQMFFGADMQTIQTDPESMDQETAKSIAIGTAAFGFFVIACFLLFPWWQNKYYDFVGNRVNFGQSGMSYSGSAKSFYAMYLIAVAIPLVFLVIMSAFIGALNLGQIFSSGDMPSAETIIGLVFLGIIGMFFLQMMPAAFVQTRRTNLVYGALVVDDVVVVSELKFGKMFYLYCTNTLAILFSLGLAIPWAKIRMARYRAETMYLLAPNLEEFVSDSTVDASAQGDAISDVFDLDIGL